MDEKNKNEKINYHNLNALIQTARVILKILLICGIVMFAFIVIEKTQILNIIGTIFSISMPLFIGFGFAWLVDPMIVSLERRKLSRKLSTFIVYILFVLVLILLLVLVVPEFISQLRELIGQVPSFVSDIKNFVTNILSNFKDSEIDINTIQNTIFAQLESIATDLTNNSLSNIVNTVTSILTSSATILLGLIIGLYFSFDFDKIQHRIKCLIPRKHKEEGDKLLHELNVMARGYVSGTLFTSLVVTFFTFIGLIISGISSPLLFAIFCGITNIVPYFGPYIGGIPTIIVAFSISPMCGIIASITIILVQTIEGNIINPIIVGRATDIHPVTIIIGLLIFQHYFGIVGMIIATPAIGAIKILFNFFNAKYHIVDLIITPKEKKSKEVKTKKDLLNIK